MISFSLNKYFVQLICLAGIISLFSCTADDMGERKIDNPSLQKAQIMLQLPDEDENTTISRATESGSADENRIKSLYLFVFDNTGAKEFEKYIDLPFSGSATDIDMSLWHSDKVIILLDNAILSNLNTSRNIHMVANVPQAKLASVTNEASLKTIITNTITAEISTPDATNALVMHGVCPAHIFSNNVRATVPLVRNVSKIRLKVNVTNSTLGTSTIQFAPDNKISVRAAGVADRSYLVSGIGQNPAGVNYINYAAKNISATSSGTPKVFDVPAIYINENTGDKSSPTDPIKQTPTYLVIQVPFNGGEGIVNDNYYKILVNEDNNFVINRNTIYDITVNINALGGETEQTAPVISATLEVLPWNEKTLVSDMTQTYISVQSTSLDVAAGEFNFYCSTNAEMAKRNITSSQTSWLSATFDSNNTIKITALGTGYTAQRSGTLTIKANDLQKTITVTQKALPVTDGSIKLNPNKIYLSSVTPTRPVTLTVTNNAQWKNLLAAASGIATYTPSSGTGNSTINFTRGGTFANGTFQFINLNTLSYDEVEVCNLSLTSGKTEIQIPGAGIVNETEDEIVALGGNANWRVKSKPDWITITNNNGIMVYSADPEPDEADRSGTIVLCHVDDENLIVSINALQSAQYVMFPEFMYLVVRYRVGSKPGGGTWDMDSQTFFQGTGISSLDHKGVGYGAVSSSTDTYVSYLNNNVMTFGGDNRRSGYETIYVNMKKLLELAYDDLPRYIRIELYDRWWNKDNYKEKVDLNLDMVLYNSGDMKSVNTYDFENTLGVSAEVWNETYTVELKTENSSCPVANNYSRSQHIGTITYDKFKNKATLVMHPAPTTRSLSNHIVVDVLPGESKEDYGKRVQELYNNK